MSNKFHDHLDRCKQCRENPFELCPLGALRLREAVEDLRVELKIPIKVFDTLLSPGDSSNAVNSSVLFGKEKP